MHRQLKCSGSTPFAVLEAARIREISNASRSIFFFPFSEVRQFVCFGGVQLQRGMVSGVGVNPSNRTGRTMCTARG